MDKKDVALVLEQIAAFLELKDENPFRVRAYQTAARAISGFTADLPKALSSGELAELKGIGPATLDIISEVVHTGHSRVLDDLREQIPHGLVEMLRIPGLGVSKVRHIHDSLHIDTLSELEEASRDGRLAKLPRFGQKTADNILKGIAFLRQVGEFRLYHNARDEAAALVKVLTEMPGVKRAEVVGSVRRRREVIRNLDFVVAVEGSPDVLVKRLGSAPGVTEYVDEADGVVTLKFTSGSVADVLIAAPNQMGFQLVRATGNTEHVADLRRRAEACGLDWTDAALLREGKPVPGEREEDIYRVLGLDFIPPELREGRGEVQAALEHRLPTLITAEDIRGFLHCHTNYSDGISTIAEWAEVAKGAGYSYIGLTDHSQAAAYAGGLNAEDVDQQHAEIDDVNTAYSDFRVLKGVEVDILDDGSLDYSPEVRARFDFIIASVHSRFGMSEDEMTARLLKAMDDPHMAILGHPTGRLLLSRDPYPLDMDAVFAKAAECGVAVEINADPQRLDLDWRMVRTAVERGVTISIGADAHSTAGIANMEIGLGVARKGWLTRENVLNTRSVDDFLEHAERRRRRA